MLWTHSSIKLLHFYLGGSYSYLSTLLLFQASLFLCKMYSVAVSCSLTSLWFDKTDFYATGYKVFRLVQVPCWDWTCWVFPPKFFQRMGWNILGLYIRKELQIEMLDSKFVCLLLLLFLFFFKFFSVLFFVFYFFLFSVLFFVLFCVCFLSCVVLFCFFVFVLFCFVFVFCLVLCCFVFCFFVFVLFCFCFFLYFVLCLESWTYFFFLFAFHAHLLVLVSTVKLSVKYYHCCFGLFQKYIHCCLQ